MARLDELPLIDPDENALILERDLGLLEKEPSLTREISYIRSKAPVSRDYVIIEHKKERIIIELPFSSS